MKSKYEQFDCSRLKIRPLAERRHDLELSRWMRLDDPAPEFFHPDLDVLAERLAAAHRHNRPVPG